MAVINDKGITTEATCEQERVAILDTFEVLGGKWKLRIMPLQNMVKAYFL